MKNFFSFVLRWLFIFTFLFYSLQPIAISAEENAGLIQAAEQGDLSKVTTILNKGGDVNVRNEYGATPLIMASYKGHIEIVRFLINNGANVNACDKERVTSLYLAAQNGYEEIVRLLINKKVNVNTKIKDHWYSPLTIAAGTGHLSIVKILIENGANIEHQDRFGGTALYYAEINELEEIADLIGTKISKSYKYEKKEPNEFSKYGGKVENINNEEINLSNGTFKINKKTRFCVNEMLVQSFDLIKNISEATVTVVTVHKKTGIAIEINDQLPTAIVNGYNVRNSYPECYSEDEKRALLLLNEEIDNSLKKQDNK